MNRQKCIILLTALAMMSGTAATLGRLKSIQRLGSPGIKTTAIPGSPRLDIHLPARVLDYDSVDLAPNPETRLMLEALPPDTSVAMRRYFSPEKDWMVQQSIVLMGTDRSSIHKPQICLPGSGWNIDNAQSSKDTVRVRQPYPYDLPVMKLICSKAVTQDGQTLAWRGIYVYWFVADHELTENHGARMWEIATHLLRTGELTRWAYVSFFCPCHPGEEDATYGRMKEFIAASVPGFQLVTGPRAAAPAASATASR